MTAASLRLHEIRFAYQGRAVLRGVTSAIEQPSVVSLIGPNGVGKSTLLKLMAGVLPTALGTCQVNGQDLAALNSTERARLVAYVPQRLPENVPFTVEQVVMTGRLPHAAGFYESNADRAAVEDALHLTELEPLRQRRFGTLSGGEQQRVLLAAVVAQSAPILLLDEPNAHLDPEHQSSFWALLKKLKTRGHITLLVTHQLQLVAQHSDRVWIVSDGQLVADGPPCDAMEPSLLERVFHVPFHWYNGRENRVFLSYGE